MARILPFPSTIERKIEAAKDDLAHWQRMAVFVAAQQDLARLKVSRLQSVNKRGGQSWRK